MTLTRLRAAAATTVVYAGAALLITLGTLHYLHLADQRLILLAGMPAAAAAIAVYLAENRPQSRAQAPEPTPGPAGYNVPQLCTSPDPFADTTPHPIHVVSFGHRHGPAPAATLTLDVRPLFPDPLATDQRDLTANDPRIRDRVLACPGATALTQALAALALTLADTGAPVTLAIGCAGGRHRAPALADETARLLNAAGFPAEATHRDIHKPVLDPAPPAREEH